MGADVAVGVVLGVAVGEGVAAEAGALAGAFPLGCSDLDAVLLMIGSASGEMTFAMGTIGLAMIGAAGVGADMIGAAGVGAVGVGAAGLGMVVAGGGSFSVATECLLSSGFGNRTTSWHFGHLILRPKTSIGTVNEAEQLGQVTLAFDMRRLSTSDKKLGPVGAHSGLYYIRCTLRCPFATGVKPADFYDGSAMVGKIRTDRMGAA